MNVTITHELAQTGVTSVLLIHENGLQIRITAGKRGFIVEPGVPVEVERWDGLAWQIVAVPEGCGAEESKE